MTDLKLRELEQKIRNVKTDVKWLMDKVVYMSQRIANLEEENEKRKKIN